MSTKNIIQIQNLGKRYRLGVLSRQTLRDELQYQWQRFRQQTPETSAPQYHWAVRNLNLEVAQGEVLGIIGPNGAGKSTLLKLLSRITAPTQGELRIRGRIASLLEVGTGFHRELTGRENIYLNGAILGMKRHEINQHFQSIVDFSGIDQYLDTPVKRYSSGMYVRLAFAVAAHLRPEILIVDEVLAVGDADFQQRALGKMEEVSQHEGRTVLFVSHNMAAIRSLCTRSIVLANGQLSYQGKTDEAIHHYLNLNAGTQLQRHSYPTTGRMQLQSAQAFGPNYSNSIQVGQALYLRFSFLADFQFSHTQARVDIRIDDQLGNRILWLSTSLINHKLQGPEVEFQLPQCPLPPGQYSITLFAQVNFEAADWLEHIAAFQVQPGDYYGTGKQIPPRQAATYVPFRIQSGQ